VSRIRLRPSSSGELAPAASGLVARLLQGEAPARVAPCSRDLVLELGFRSGFPEAVALPEARAYHYRDWEQREIGLLVERRHDGALLGIEVKAAQSATRDDFRHLAWFRDNLAGGHPFTGVVLYTGTSVASLGQRPWTVPFSALWS
jgi:hypothetical protein